MLYIVLFLHQTATSAHIIQCTLPLYIVLFLHQTATFNLRLRSRIGLYIVLFLHQTATRVAPLVQSRSVVYRSIPTSNRNLSLNGGANFIVVYRSIPTSNRNSGNHRLKARKLYIVLFLHQTATAGCVQPKTDGCISFYSYIKPQLS